jgi:hypothetical protein
MQNSSLYFNLNLQCLKFPYSVYIRSTWNNLQHTLQFLLHDVQESKFTYVTTQMCNK